ANLLFFGGQIRTGQSCYDLPCRGRSAWSGRPTPWPGGRGSSRRRSVTRRRSRRPPAPPAQAETEASMTPAVVGVGLAVTRRGGWCVTPADDPPRELTPEERKELEAKLVELDSAGTRAAQAGKLSEAAEARKKALETARRLYAKQDHTDLAGMLNNLAVV